MIATPTLTTIPAKNKYTMQFEHTAKRKSSLLI